MALFQRVCELDLEGIVAKQKFGPYVTERQHSTWYKIRNRGYSQMLGEKNYSSVTGTANLSSVGIRVSWRVLMSKARLSTAPGTASILMLILPNSVKSAPHLVEYLLGSPNAPARCGIAFCVVIRQDAPKREVRILFLQELPDLCS